jgi:hypothetical protein
MERFLGIFGQDPSVSMTNWLHIYIFWLFFIYLGHIPQIPLQMIGFSCEVFNFSNSTGSFATKVGGYEVAHFLPWTPIQSVYSSIRIKEHTP